MDRDLYIMGMFLVMSQEILNRFKNGQRLSTREKVICLNWTLRTFIAWQNLANGTMYLQS